MQALILEQQDGKTLASVQHLEESQLPAGDVTVDVHWSSLNYKDALAITGKGKIIRHFPMIPGIDFAGTVHASEDPRFHAGQEVLLTGWGVGENHWGGLAERARVKGDWLVALPAGLSSRNAMIIGTAGFTAMLCVMALEDAGIRPQEGEVVVTGASGGVGSTAVALLHSWAIRLQQYQDVKAPTAILRAWELTVFSAAMSLLNLARWKNSCGPVQLIPLAIKCWRKCWHR